MEPLTISEISPNRIAAECFSLIRYKHRVLELSVESRRRTAFMCVLSGRLFYTFEGGELALSAGDILYLPEGGRYRYRVEGETECLQMELRLYVDGEPAAFSSHPVLLSCDLFRMRQLLKEAEQRGSPYENNAAVFSLLGSLQGTERPPLTQEMARILPAVRHIDAHYREAVYVKDLAALCRLGQSQLRRLFAEALGMSPIAYKNQVRMKAACHMLCYTDGTVTEVAETMGFDSVYVFSRVFRKYVGVSPSAYRKQMR